MRLGKKVRYIISRAHLVPLGEDRRAGMVFDSETMSYSLGWTNDQSLKSQRNAFCRGTWSSGSSKRKATNLFRTNMRPGWAKTKEMINKDPRRQPYKSFPRMGALPKKWAHFKGHYVHKGKAIFSYSVGDGKVLDIPGIVKQKGLTALTRTVQVEKPFFISDAACSE